MPPRCSWDSGDRPLSPLSVALRDVAEQLMRMYSAAISGKEPHGAWLVGSRVDEAMRRLPDAPSAQYARDLLHRVRQLSGGMIDPGEIVYEVVARETLAELADLIRREDERAAKTHDGVVGDDTDPVANGLSGRVLDRYLFLRSRKHWTSYDTLRDVDTLWRYPQPEDDTIHNVLKVLQTALARLEEPIRLEIDRPHQRCRLVR